MVQFAEPIPQRDQPNPGQDGIADKEIEPACRESGLNVQEGPENGREPAAADVDAIQRIMTGNEEQGDGQQYSAAGIQQTGQDDHADTEGPDHLQDKDAVVEIKGPAEGNDQ